MSWNQNLPFNSTEIRIYPQVLTDNFKAIQAGNNTLQYRQNNFINRNDATEVPPPTPDPIDKVMILYAKTEASSTEMFILNDQNISDDIQITQIAALGSTSTPLNASTLSFDVDATTGLEYVDGQMIVAYGKFTNNGTLLFSKNMSEGSPKKDDTGTFNVRVNADVLKNANYIISGSVTDISNSGGSLRGIMPVLFPAPILAMPTQIQIWVKRDGGRTDDFDDFYIMICGGR